MPTIIKYFVLITALLSLSTAMLTSSAPEFCAIISLSLRNFHYHQFLTALFLLPREIFTFGFLVNLIFNLYIIASLGKDLLGRFGAIRFILLLLTLGLFSELAALGIMGLNIGYMHPFGANMAITIGIITTWLILNFHANLYLFHFIHIKASSALILILCLTLFACLSPFDAINLAAYIVSALLGAIFAFIFKKNFFFP